MLRPRVRSHIYLYIYYIKDLWIFSPSQNVFTVFVWECSGESLLERIYCRTVGQLYKLYLPMFFWNVNWQQDYLCGSQSSGRF